MEYLSHTRSHPFELRSNYSTHLSSTTQFPDITMKHNNLVRTNIMEFYKQPQTLRRSMTTLGTSHCSLMDENKPVTTSIIPLVNSNIKKSVSIRSGLSELEGLKVPFRDPYLINQRSALYTRYTVNDWTKSSQNLYGNSVRAREAAEQIRGDSLRLGRNFDEKVKSSQDDSTKKLGDRINDVDKLKKDLDESIGQMVSEIEMLQRAKLVLEKALQETENPLSAAQQCLYNREKRARIDLVHDNVEKELLKEIDTIKRCQDDLHNLIKRSAEQLKSNRLAQSTLTKDVNDKYQALKLDEMARNLKNHSAGLAYHNNVLLVNNCVSSPDSWTNQTRENLTLAANEREKSVGLREEINRCLSRCQHEMWTQWLEVNSALSRRIQEVVEAKNYDQEHLKKIQQEIFDTEKNIEYLKKAILDKQDPLKVAQSRLSIRLDRPNMEACNDVPRNRLIAEVEEIQQSITTLQQQLRVAEAALHNLLINKSDVESDLNIKNNSVFIDREQCLGIRRTFSINDEAKRI